MRRLLSVLILFVAIGGESRAADVTGEVNASWASPQLFSVDEKAKFYPGFRLTVNVAGTIDFNPEHRYREECDWTGLFCDDIRWIDHHFMGPQQLPTRLVFQRENDPADVIELTVNQGPSTVDLPADVAGFTKPYFLLTTVAGTGSGLSPQSSVGNFSVSVDVSANGRLSALKAYLAKRQPRVTDIVNDRNVVDRYLRDKFAKDVGAILREHAAKKYLLSETTARSDHLELLRFAQKLAPGDFENLRAIADYYVQIGLPGEAEKEYAALIAGLEDVSRTSPTANTDIQLGISYSSLAKTIAESSGGIEEGSLQRADAFYAKAAEVFQKNNFPDLYGATLASRAAILRRLRSSATLKTAIALYEQAGQTMAAAIIGDVALPSADGASLLAGPVYDGLELVDLETGGKTRLSEPGGDYRLAAWDPAGQRGLVQKGDSLSWLDPTSGKRTDVQGSFPDFAYYQAANRTILTLSALELKTIKPSGSEYPLKLGDVEGCEYELPSPFPVPPDTKPFLAKGYGPAELSFDGDAVVISCGSELSVKLTSDAGLTDLGTHTLIRDDGSHRTVQNVAVSNAGKLMVSIASGIESVSPAQGALPFAEFKHYLVGWHPGINISPAFDFQLETPAQQIPQVITDPDGKYIFVFYGPYIEVRSGDDGTVIQTINISMNTPMIFPQIIFALNLEMFDKERILIRASDDKLWLLNINSSQVQLVKPTEKGTIVSFTGYLIPNSAKPDNPLLLRPARFFELSKRLPDGTPDPDSVPAVFGLGAAEEPRSIEYLSGGGGIIANDRFTGEVSLYEIGKRPQTTNFRKAGSRYVGLAAAKANQWLLIELDRGWNFQNLTLFELGKKLADVPLPPVPVSAQEIQFKNYEDIVAQFKASGSPNLLPPTYPDALRPEDMEFVLANRDKIKFGWQIVPRPQAQGPFAMQAIAIITTADGRKRYQPLWGAYTELILDPQATSSDDIVGGTVTYDIDVGIITLLNPRIGLIGDYRANSQLAFYDLQTRERIAVAPQQTNPSSLIGFSLSSDGNRVAIALSAMNPSGTSNSELKLFDIADKPVELPCNECKNFKPLPENVEFEAWEARGSMPNLMSAIAVDSTVERMFFTSDGFAMGYHIGADKRLLITGLSLPMYIGKEIAINREAKHKMRVFRLAR